MTTEADAEFDRLFDLAMQVAFEPPPSSLTVARLREAVRALNAIPPIGSSIYIDPSPPLDIDSTMTMQVAPKRPLEDLVQSVLEYEGLDDELEEVG